MLKKISQPIFLTILIILFLGAIILLVNYKKPSETKATIDASVWPVEKVAFNPAQYPGYIGLRGTVNKIVDNQTFVLGCQDACVAVPIKYDGQSPDLGQEIIIYGQLSEQNGQYTFVAETLKPAN